MWLVILCPQVNINLCIFNFCYQVYLNKQNEFLRGTVECETKGGKSGVNGRYRQRHSKKRRLMAVKLVLWPLDLDTVVHSKDPPQFAKPLVKKTASMK